MIWGNSTSFSAVAAKRAITNRDDDDSASTSTALVTPTKPKNKSAASSSADGSKMKASVLTIWNKAEQHVLSFQQTQDQLCSAEGLCTLLAKNVSALHVKVKKALESDVYAKYSEGWEDGMPDTRGMKALDVLKVADKRLPLMHCGCKGCGWISNSSMYHLSMESAIYTHLDFAHRRDEMVQVPECEWDNEEAIMMSCNRTV